ncbi:MAG: hypothetical protein M3Q10_08540 [Chloroflexota bacterium]|nr:hypothetical protein [Chloroflexota bacterium]
MGVGQLSVERRLVWSRPWLLRLAGAMAVLAALVPYVAAFQATWIDDAYIQLRYARTLIDSGTWGFYPGYPANTATSPLNVLLLALVGLPLGSVTSALLWLTVAELAALLWLLLRLSRRLFGGPFFGWFAFVAVATNLLLLSTIGMESLLYALLMVAAVVLFLEGRWPAMGVALGLLTLARPDGVLLLAILLPLAEAGWRRKGEALLAYAATIAPWFVYSWLALGSFVPDTLVIKVNDRAWGATTFADGLALFLHRFPLETASSLLLAPLAIFPVWRCAQDVVRVATVLVAYAALHYALYTALGVPPFHWYFVHQIVPLLLLGSMGAAYHAGRLEAARPRWLGWVRWPALLVPAAGLLLLAWDEGFPFREAPINTNWATSGQYRGAGLWMRENLPPGAGVAVHGEIGTVSLFAGQYLVNEFSDMSVADRLIAEAGYEGRSGVIGPLAKLNFWWRREHRPLPAPTYELVQPNADGLPRCVPEDPACRMAWDAKTDWIRGKWIVIRQIG